MKYAKVFVLLVAFLLLLTACSNSTHVNTPSESTAAAQGTAQLNGRPADIYGRVKSIVGNEITLELAEQKMSAELTDEEKAQQKAEKQALSDEERQQLKDEQIKFTGELAVIIIPVGIPITSSNGSGDKENLTELQLTDIHEGTFLNIWQEQEGSGEVKYAEYVRVLQSVQ